MDQTKNLCAQIPTSLHERVCKAKEQSGLTTAQYITNPLSGRNASGTILWSWIFWPKSPVRSALAGCVWWEQAGDGRQTLAIVPFAEWDAPYFAANTPGRIAAYT